MGEWDSELSLSARECVFTELFAEVSQVGSAVCGLCVCVCVCERERESVCV